MPAERLENEALARRQSDETPDRQVLRTEASVARLWPELRGQLDEPPEHVCSTHIRCLQSLRTEAVKWSLPPRIIRERSAAMGLDYFISPRVGFYFGSLSSRLDGP